MSLRPPRSVPTPAERPPPTPVRSCVVCRRRAAKRDLLRWVVGADRVPMPDPGARLPGRGRYVCRAPDCLARLARRAASEGLDFAAAEVAFRLALGRSLVENDPGKAHEN